MKAVAVCATILVAVQASAASTPLVLVQGGVPRVAFRVDAADSVEARVAQIAVRRIAQRTGGTMALLAGGAGQPAVIRLRTLPDEAELGNGGFRIARTAKGAQISGCGPRGLGAGVGRFLRSLVFSDGEAVWPGKAVVERTESEKRMRCEQYKPGQWGNSFEDAPMDKVRGYLEDQLLWGTDCIWNACWHNLDDPFAPGADAASRDQWQRMCDLLAYAESIGLDTGYVDCANSVYADQVHLRRLGGKLRYPEDVCPSVPEARAVLLRNRENAFREAARTGLRLRYLLYFAHDNGGCDCAKCLPWVPTYLKIVHEYWQLAKRYHPGVEVYLTTWLCSRAEERAMLDFLETEKPDWIAGVMDRPGVALPAPYRSIGWQTDFGCGPRECYGKMGADPAPDFMAGKILSYYKQGIRGIFTYTEGIYDDINSAAITQVCRRPDATSIPAFMDEYCRWNFGLYGEDLSTMSRLLQAHFEWQPHGPYNAAVHVREPRVLLETLNRIEQRMPDWALANWRYGILRTRIELELLDDQSRAGTEWEKEVCIALRPALGKNADGDVAIARARQAIADSNARLDAVREQCTVLTDRLYNELYESPNRHPVHGRFSLPPSRSALAKAVDARLAALQKEANPDKRRVALRRLAAALSDQPGSVEAALPVLTQAAALTIPGIQLQGGGGLSQRPDLVLARSANTLCGRDGKRGRLAGSFTFEPGEEPLVTPVELCVTARAFGVTPYWFEIKLNSTCVHSGSGTFPQGKAGDTTVAIPTAAVRGGRNELVLSSLEPGDATACLLVEAVRLRVTQPGEVAEPGPVARAESPPKTAAVRPNLARKRPAFGSSQYDERFPAGRAADGEPLTLRGASENAWSCERGKDEGAWWKVDLGTPARVGLLRVWYRHITTLGGYAFVPKSVTVEVSANGAEWRTVLERVRDVPEEGTPYRSEPSTYALPEATTARWVRLLFEEGGQRTAMPVVQLSEVEIHAEAR